MAFKMAPKTPLMMALKGNQPNLPEAVRKAIEAAPGKMMDSPAKMSEGEKYDIKMSSDQNIKPGARKNYAENAEAAQKSSPTKNMNKGYGTPAKKKSTAATRIANGDKTPMPPTAAAKNMNKGYGSPALQTSDASRKTVGGKPKKDMKSAADVPRTTSFGGNDYHLGLQAPSGTHYYNKGYSSKDGKQGTVKRPGDEGIYHVSRKIEKPIPSLKPKKAKIATAKTGATKLATVNTEKPKVSKTKRETRRGKRADKLEKRVNKLRGDSPAKQTSKTQRKRDHDARMQERSDNPRVAAHNDKLGHESPRKADYVVNAFNENAGNWGYSMKPVGKAPMKRPSTASRKDNTSI